MKLTATAVVALLKERKVDVEIRSLKNWPGASEYDLWSPVGQVFTGTGCHSSVEVGARDLVDSWKDGWLDFEPCTDAECDTCHPEDADEEV